jgi:hypothetical protein
VAAKSTEKRDFSQSLTRFHLDDSTILDGVLRRMAINEQFGDA